MGKKYNYSERREDIEQADTHATWRRILRRKSEVDEMEALGYKW